MAAEGETVAVRVTLVTLAIADVGDAVSVTVVAVVPVLDGAYRGVSARLLGCSRRVRQESMLPRSRPFWLRNEYKSEFRALRASFGGIFGV